MTGIVVFATIFLVAAVYEAAVIYERWYKAWQDPDVPVAHKPTITEIVKAGGWVPRIVVAVLGSLALLDHFVTGVLL